MGTVNSDSTGQSLFIVDRDWLRQGSKARKSWTGNVRNRSLYGLAIQATQYDIPGTAVRRKSQTKAGRKRRDKQGDAIDSESQSELDQCLQQNTPLMQIQQEYHSFIPARHNRTSSIGDDTITLDHVYAPKSWPENPALHPPISSGFPGLECVRGLKCYLDYYLDVVGTAQYPIEARFRLQSNPIRSSWFPLAFEDDVWLQNIVLFSASHHASNQGVSPPQGANALMSSFLSQLNERISRSDLSDGTIASVSCLMLGEHIKGNHQLAKVHASGMAEMVRLRGGLHMVERVRRSKIFRADIIRSADTLEELLLPRLPNQALPLCVGPEGSASQLAETLAKLPHTIMSSTLVALAWTMSAICATLERAWTGQGILDTTSYYEHVLCLNHDLLSFRPNTAFDQALKLTMINFTQPMFRYCAYTQNSCELRAQRLRAALEQVRLQQYDQDVVLWMLFTGYMNSQPTTEHDWFKAQLKHAFEQRGLSTRSEWQTLKEYLQTFLWTDSIHDQLGKHFFENLERDNQGGLPHLNNMCLTCRGNN